MQVMKRLQKITHAAQSTNSGVAPMEDKIRIMFQKKGYAKTRMNYAKRFGK
jgi:hypothetical protein